MILLGLLSSKRQWGMTNGALLAFFFKNGSQDAFVKFWWPSRFLLQNHENRKFTKLSGGQKIGYICVAWG
jgi:hypothetical protein